MEVLQGRLSVVDSSFTSLGPSGTIADDMMMVLGDRMDSLNLSFGAVQGEVTSLAGERSTAGADATSAAEQFGLVSSMVSELAANLSTAEDAISMAGTDFDALGAAGAAAQERMAGASAAIDLIGVAAPVAADAAEGLDGGLSDLGDRLSTLAVDPFMWMMAGPPVVAGGGTAGEGAWGRA